MNPKTLGIIFIVIGLVCLGLVLADIFTGIAGWLPVGVGLIMGPVLLFLGIQQERG